MPYQLKAELIMSAEDIALLNALPDNMPETNVKPAHKLLVDTVYRQHLTTAHITMSWGIELYENKMKDKWPGGERVTIHHAKRILLTWLLELQDKPILTDTEAADLFHGSLTGQQEYGYMLYKGFKKIN